jgi:hypothetical protein
VRLDELYRKYSDQVQFLVIYIREAHPVDGWYLWKGASGMALKLARFRAARDVYDPKTIAERRSVAHRCQTELEYAIPTLVDDMDDSLNKAYAAWPTRLYLIGEDGRVVYAGGLGPFGFHPAELGKAIEVHLARERATIPE